MEELISIILSTYNETCEMILKSIFSILNQSYSNIELLLINDNPVRKDLNELLSKLQKQDSRIIYIKHKTNQGLVKSLNEGIHYAKGYYIARMDADDISDKKRLENQLKFLICNSYDLVGCSITKIDDQDRNIGELKMPVRHEDILKYNDYGSCVLHPTWLVKKEVYKALNGYREIYACEDYDFLLRAIQSGYKLGNLPQKLLFYRIRENGVSSTASLQQKLTMYYLVKNKSAIKELSIDTINDYFQSLEYKNNLRKIGLYEMEKQKICNNKECFIKKITGIFQIVINKYFYINMLAYFKRKQREKYCK